VAQLDIPIDSVPYLQPFHSVKFHLENGDLGSMASAAVRFGCARSSSQLEVGG